MSIRCSICVSGVCLTATELSENMFKAGLAPETLRRTYLGELTTGDLVNLERASVIGGRNSGHFVQGHVDGTGSVKERWVDNDSLWYKIETTQEILKYIVPKGFIAVDGTSLTVVDVNPIENWFTFMLVEYTQKKIVIPTKVMGDLVNLEVDILGKYSDQSYANIVLRLETLEAQVERLERKLSNLS
jgi:riboflavin synthase